MTKFIDIKRKSLPLFQSDYIRLQSVVSSITLGSTQYKQFPLKKKREGEGKEIGRKEEKKKKGWKEFVRKERERGE